MTEMRAEVEAILADTRKLRILVDEMDTKLDLMLAQMEEIRDGLQEILDLSTTSPLERITIAPEEIRVDMFSTGMSEIGTYRVVCRIVHLPTGVVVNSEESKSDLQAKAQALTLLEERIRAGNG